MVMELVANVAKSFVWMMANAPEKFHSASNTIKTKLVRAARLATNLETTTNVLEEVISFYILEKTV